VKKLRFREGSGVDSHWQAALTIYEATLRLLHPFMPFVTEELWQRLIHGTSANDQQPKSISLAAFPTASVSADTADTRMFTLLQEVVTATRELRADNKLDSKAIIRATLFLHSGAFAQEDLSAIGSLTKLNLTQQKGALSEHKGLVRSAPEFDLQLHSSAPAASQNGAVSTEARARLEKEIESFDRLIANAERQLGDKTFLSRAPEKVVAGLRAKLAEYKDQQAKNKKLLEGLG